MHSIHSGHGCASDNQEATPVQTILPCLAVQVMCYGIFAEQSLTKGQHWPKAGKKKKDLKNGSFFSGFSHFVSVVILHHEGG